MKKYYHYTRLSNAKKIVETKKIKRATLYIPKDEKPICWLSTNDVHEASAYNNFTFQQIIDLGYVRFTIKDAKILKIKHWKTIAKKANMSPQVQQHIAGNTEANPAEWYGTLKDIPLSLIENIEYRDDNQNWISISAKDLLALEPKLILVEKDNRILGYKENDKYIKKD